MCCLLRVLSLYRNTQSAVFHFAKEIGVSVCCFSGNNTCVAVSKAHYLPVPKNRHFREGQTSLRF
jgi:hypothetical protein